MRYCAGFFMGNSLLLLRRAYSSHFGKIVVLQSDSYGAGISGPSASINSAVP